jgi:hypothetical protein
MSPTHDGPTIRIGAALLTAGTFLAASIVLLQNIDSTAIGTGSLTFFV